MPDKLDKKLTNIEEKLGGTETVPAYVQDRLGWHLDYIESLIGGGGGDVQLKTLNNEELKGEGNIEIPVVTANPETTGEETKLNSLQVGNNKFLLGGAGGGHCYIIWYNRGSGWPLYFIYYFSPTDNLDFAGIRQELLDNNYTSVTNFLRVVGFYSPNFSGSWGSDTTVPETVDQFTISGIYALDNVSSTIYIRGRRIKTKFDTTTKAILGVRVDENPANYASFTDSSYTTITKIY